MLVPAPSESSVGPQVEPARELSGQIGDDAPRDDHGALAARALDALEHERAVRPADQRAHLRRVLGGIADDDALGRPAEALDELVVHAVLDEDARGREADLAVGQEDPGQRVPDGGVEVGVVAHDHRALAAQLENRSA